MKMRALVVEATRAPKPGYVFSEQEKRTGFARFGSSVWKNPVYGVKDVDVPAVGPNEVLIKVMACGVCGSDGHVHHTDAEGYIGLNWWSAFPCTPGHEFSGVVVEVGAEVVNFKPGDNVTAEEMQYCGSCDACRTYHFNCCSNLREPGLTVPGAMAQYIKAHERFVWNIDEIIDAYGDGEGFEIGALVEPTGIAYNATIVKPGGVRPGQYGAVYGAGPIGLGSIALMRQGGVAKIFAFEMNPDRRELARRFGADYVYNPAELAKAGVSIPELVMEKTRGWGLDVQVEAAGKPLVTYPQMDKSMACGGVIVNVAHSPDDERAIVNLAQLGWLGSFVGGSNGHAGDGIFKRVISLLAAKRIDYREMITARFGLDGAVDGILEMAKQNGGKIMIHPWE